MIEDEIQLLRYFVIWYKPLQQEWIFEIADALPDQVHAQAATSDY